MQKIVNNKSFHFIQAIFIMLFSFLSSTVYAGGVPFDKIVVFGDSLSDTGFTSRVSGGGAPCYRFYYEGRFSNGPIWVEHIAKALNFDITNEDQFVGLAFGGAWAGDDISYDPKAVYKISYEIEDYLNENSQHNEQEAKHLFVLWAGSNDYLSGDPSIPLQDATKDALNTIEHNLEILIADGARNFLILNLTDLGNTPKSRLNGPQYVERMTALSKLHNENLLVMLNKLREKHKEVKIVDIDVMPYFNDLMTNPQKYQLNNVTDYCYDGDYICFDNVEENVDAAAKKKAFALVKPKPFSKFAMTTISTPDEEEHGDWRKWHACSNPNDFVYWDKLHPTAAVHRHLAGFVVERIKAEWNITE